MLNIYVRTEQALTVHVCVVLLEVLPALVPNRVFVLHNSGGLGVGRVDCARRCLVELAALAQLQRPPVRSHLGELCRLVDVILDRFHILSAK